jgi:hypothetical protein
VKIRESFFFGQNDTSIKKRHGLVSKQIV